MTDIEDQLCEELRHPSWVNFVFSLLIAVGIVLSYLPQHFRIAIRKSSRGLSPWFLLLGAASSACALANVLLLSTDVLSCCSMISGGQCFAASLGVIQVSLQFAMFSVIVYLFIAFFPRDPQLVSDWHRAVYTVVAVLVHYIITFILAILFHKFGSVASVESYAVFLGMQGTVLAILQYLPQIYTTYKFQHPESLSIHSLLMQAPGSLIWAITLAMRPGTEWSTWMPYLSAAVLQGVLLSMCFYYLRLGRIQLPLDNDLVPANDASDQDIEEDAEPEELVISFFDENAR
ncbi:uncharacterized protein V1516DRAFT_676601 [Lipomyces oligophaga]|uniref:uncharacterized protein n=1 Tax=Lipomyces oligophaga TaxID=45792 RepID=UPI0034CEF000